MAVFDPSAVSMLAQPNLTLAVTWYLLGMASAAVRVHSAARP